MLARLQGGVPSVATVGAVLSALRGHFALVLEGDGWTLAAVDRLRTTPLFYAHDRSGWRIADRGGDLARDLGFGIADIGPDAALALAMAGYTIGADTLYRGLHSLVAGEAVLLTGSQEQRIRYHRYRAWDVVARSDDVLQRDLADTTLGILRTLMDRAGDRPIVIPLSAGLDSRLIVSGLHHLGCRTVRCFSYGLAGNYEADAAQRIAAHLGYEWRFVPFSIGALRRFFASDDHAAYLAYADTCTNVPFEQDLYALRVLQAQGYIPDDAILVNGNSGDFISGGHIPKTLHRPDPGLSAETRTQTVIHALVEKHFRLWASLATPERDRQIARRLAREIDGAEIDFQHADSAHGGYEFCELQDRQSKYVIAGQRIYEHAGLDWSLPLWDDDYLDFWQSVPLHAKAGQALYRAMLEAQNWGGVWQGQAWQFARTVSPGWLRLPRLALKALHLPFGQARWRRFERRFLQYWMNNLASAAFQPYSRIARDPHGARHDVAWQVAAYLAGKGLDFAGRPAAGIDP
ncbi:MAG: asparagine synthase-related protein [Alphaproteobacteria bacterium]